MANYLVADTDLTSVANAIRTKGGTSAALAFPDGFVDAVEAIETGGDVSETLLANGSYTATADVSSVQIPVSCTGKVTRVLVAIKSTPSVNQTTLWAREYNLPSEMESIMSYFAQTVQYVASTGKYTYDAKSITNNRDMPILLDAVTNPTIITVYQYNPQYPIKSGNYDWYIWGMEVDT